MSLPALSQFNLPIPVEVKKILDSVASDERLSRYLPGGLLLSGLGLAYVANQYLSSRALNYGTKAKFDWDKEIILITGGSNGIGAATVQKLLKRGNQIVVVDVLPLTYKQDGGRKDSSVTIPDPNSPPGLTLFLSEVGDPTVIIANAGICRGRPILAAQKKDIELTFGVNTLGLIWTIKAFLPSLVARNHGHVLIVASQTGHTTTAGVTDYSASKAAAIAIYEGIHTEMKHVYKAPAVRVSCISPSHVQTAMFTGVHSVPGMSSLTPTFLAEKICGILYSGRAQNVMVPRSAYATTLMRVLPDWVRVYLQDLAAGAFTDLKPHDPLSKSA
ncbi:hypothetical protein AK830_g8235 [Neonectria ditissima]|uniref:Short-chain dehydrogenase/reductase family 16C member 6 n=1 Tax=Neonectria ditissima TaxID=78410 RepID=A0A0P7BBX2_9HYPO|nr:hypothetical protein AK830_g8235 [Neonectria ditissima]